jgi:hypothetical protein
MTGRNPVRAKDRQHQSRFTRPILFVFPTSGTCSCGVAPRDNVLRASAEPRAIWINSLFVASRRVVRLLVFGGRQSTFRVCPEPEPWEPGRAEREIERIEGRRKKLIEMVMEGVPPSEVKDELTANAARREDLKAKLAAADAPPPLLHPEMAELYRQKVTTLAQALQEPETRVEAREALRGLIDAIILTPSAGELRIDLKGNLAAMLSAATNAKRSPETGDLSLQVEMVAGAGFEPATFGL